MGSWAKSRAISLAAATLLLSFGSAAAQDSNPLSSVCTGVLAQSNINVGDADRLCSCLQRQVTTQLSPTEMSAYAAASQEGKDPPKEVLDKVMGIAATCLQQQQPQ